MQTEPAHVILRGTREGVLIVLGQGDWDALMIELERQLARPNAAAFFRGARVSVETGDRFLTENERSDLERRLTAHGIQVGTLAPTIAPPERNRPERPEVYIRHNGNTETLIIRRTVRSGQIVQHEGPVIVFGDVNDGAQIIATGDVLVFGKLRGLVHAGAGGDDHATIGALTLNPPQLRIGNQIARAPEGSKRKGGEPEMACVRAGHIVIEPWRV
jgi:septum site-determining protein MinC